MRVLGIDPSSSLCGAALVVNGELQNTWTWHKDKRKSDAWNLHCYYHKLRGLVRLSKPDIACVEFLSVTRNAGTTRKVSHFQAASVLACKEEGVTVVEARVSQARKEALGNGGMDKDAAHQAIKKMFPGHKFKAKTSGGYDETDATVLAVAAPGLVELA